MDNAHAADSSSANIHVFLGADSARNEKRTWIVVGLTTIMTILEIVGGSLFHSIALVADGIHMSTHAGVMLLAAIAYRYARSHAHDRRFALGTGKLGDLAAFANAIVLGMIALLIAYEAITRFLSPENIDFAAAIPIACLGLVVNAVSAFVLAGSHDHSHHHGHDHGADDHHSHDAAHTITTSSGSLQLAIFEKGVPPRFRLHGLKPDDSATIETVRPNGKRQIFALINRTGYLESIDPIPEPHAFTAKLALNGPDRQETHDIRFEENEHDSSLHRDNNMRAAYIHVVADCAVSALVVVGLLLAMYLGWTFMDPIMGLVGALVIANWAVGLVRAAGAILLDMEPNPDVPAQIRTILEADGTRVTDLHVWRLGPGHLGAIIELHATNPEPSETYRSRIAGVRNLSHITIEVCAA